MNMPGAGNAQVERRESHWGRAKRLITGNPALVALIFLVALFGIMNTRFLSIYNIRNILNQISVVAILAFGMTYVITAGEIDLSVGSVLCFSGMVFMALSATGTHVVLGTLLTIAMGALIGLATGVVVTYFRIPSFIVSLASMSMFRGFSLLLRGGTTISDGIQPSYYWFGQAFVAGIPVSVIILAVAFAFMWFVYGRTVFGVHLRAVGSNQESARLAGISSAKIKVLVFIVTGICSAIAGIITSSRLGIGSPGIGYAKEMDAITGVVLGGTLFTGGAGSVSGSLIGSLVVAVLGNGLNLLGMSSYWQQVIMGLVLVVALAVNRFKE